MFRSLSRGDFWYRCHRRVAWPIWVSLFKIVLIIPHMENGCLGKLVRREPWLNRGGQVDIYD